MNYGTPLEWLICAPLIAAEMWLVWKVLNRYEKEICAWLDDFAERLRNPEDT